MIGLLGIQFSVESLIICVFLLCVHFAARDPLVAMFWVPLYERIAGFLRVQRVRWRHWIRLGLLDVGAFIRGFARDFRLVCIWPTHGPMGNLPRQIHHLGNL
jgi:hypothetical protein